jgi:hypothetical protein
MTGLLRVRPELPANEEWMWQTDLLVSQDGTEQRINLSEYPKRSNGGTYKLDDALKINQYIRAMVEAKGGALDVPFFQYSARLTADAGPTDTALAFSARDTQIADGDYILLYEDSETSTQLIQIDTVGASSSSLVTPLGLSWPAGTLVCPVHSCVARSGLTLERRNPDNWGTIDFMGVEAGFHTPFLNPYNTASLNLLGGYPVLDVSTPVGDKFRDQWVDGSELYDYGGVVQVRSPWQRTKTVFERAFRVPRANDLSDWEWWFKFADTIRGAWQPFWLPSYRPDFTAVVAPAPGGTTMTLDGHHFRDFCFPFAGLKGLFIETDAGTHFALATAAVGSGSNDAVTFSPALPVGSGWATNQKIGLLYMCRIQDDKMVWQHQSAHSYVQLNILTTDN